MSQLAKSIKSTYRSPRISLPNRLLDRLNYLYLSCHTTTSRPIGFYNLFTISQLKSPTNHPLEKDKDKLSSLSTLHLSLRPFSFSLHLTLVNSRKNKNRKMMTYTYNIIHHIYIYIHILYISFNSSLPIHIYHLSSISQ